MTQRLDQDHKCAKMLAEGLAQLPYIDIDPEKCYTNMVFFGLTEDAPMSETDITGRLKDEFDILMGGTYGAGFRAVTHYWIDEDKVAKTLGAMKTILTQ